MTEDKLPAFRPAPAGRIERVDYPFRNEQQPGTVMLPWPADRKLTNRDRTLLSLFLDNAAGGADTNLYKRFIDSRGPDAAFGAKGVGAFVDADLGNAVYIMFRDVPPAHMNDHDLTDLRAKTLDEFARIAAYPDGSSDLKEFNTRLKGRILEERRGLSKFVNSPPGFGFRSTSSAWMEHLLQLNKEPGFQKSLTEKADLAAIETLISSDRNIWRDYLTQWRIAGVTPYVEASKPNPDLIRQEQKEREERAAAETARLKTAYHAATEQEALRRYRDEYDATTAALEKSTASMTPPKFIDNPPLTLDDQLDFKTTHVGGRRAAWWNRPSIA